jgi:hypothetical protein
MLRTHRSVIPPLLPLEEQIKREWNHNPVDSRLRSRPPAETTLEIKSENEESGYLLRMMRAATDTVKFSAREKKGLEIGEDGRRKEGSALPKDTLVQRLSKKIRGKGDGTL